MAFLRSRLVALLLVGIVCVCHVDAAEFFEGVPRPTKCEDPQQQIVKGNCYDPFVAYLTEGGSTDLMRIIPNKVSENKFCVELNKLRKCVKDLGDPCPEIKSQGILLGYDIKTDPNYMAVISSLKSEEYRCNGGQALLGDDSDCVEKISKKVVESKCQNKISSADGANYAEGTCTMQKVYVNCLMESFGAKCGNKGQQYACYYYTKGINAVNRRCADELLPCDSLASDDGAEKPKNADKDDDKDDKDSSDSSAMALGLGISTIVAAILRV